MRLDFPNSRKPTSHTDSLAPCVRAASLSNYPLRWRGAVKRINARHRARSARKETFGSLSQSVVSFAKVYLATGVSPEGRTLSDGFGTSQESTEEEE